MPCQRLDDFVVHGAAIQRVGMSDDGHAANRRALRGVQRLVAQGLDSAGRTVQAQSLGLDVHESVLRLIADNDPATLVGVS